MTENTDNTKHVDSQTQQVKTDTMPADMLMEQFVSKADGVRDKLHSLETEYREYGFDYMANKWQTRKENVSEQKERICATNDYAAMKDIVDNKVGFRQYA